jgi:hypothetical protein
MLGAHSQVFDFLGRQWVDCQWIKKIIFKSQFFTWKKYNVEYKKYKNQEKESENQFIKKVECI